jgi:pyruvate dehydrogenase (quinone)
MPPTIDFEQAKGFGIYLVKAMLNGRGDEVLDLAKPICGRSFKAALNT